MKTSKQTSSQILRRRRGLASWLVAGIAVGVCAVGHAQHSPLVQPTPGGLSARPIITAITNASGSNFVHWQCFGPGPFQLERRANVATGAWQSVGTPGKVYSARVAQPAGPEFYRVKAPAANYAGAHRCTGCHGTIHAAWRTTSHTNAFNTLKAIGQQNNAECLPCHTVGYDVPHGFVSELTTPSLVGVQCESCHGPAGAHRNDTEDPALVPTVTQSAKLCGGCHMGPMQPTYEEWSASGHGRVVPSVANSFISQGVSRVNSCGACHSGAARLMMLKAETVTTNDLALIADTGITCVVCHDSHGQTVHGHQLRYPLWSTNHYSYSTSTNLLSQHNPNINLCGQCHNMRGAVWTSTGRYPHYSPQYNMLIGTGGVDDARVTQQIGLHRTIITKQCAHCHVHKSTVPNPTPENPNHSGHGFHVSLDSCTSCHADPTVTKNNVKTEIQGRIAALKDMLINWVNTRADAVLRDTYGVRGWEYTTPGHISNPTGVTTPGPSATHQALIPDTIKKARFNIYLVYQDHSYGAHNARYARYLLNVAETNLVEALAAPSPLPLAGSP